MADDEDAVQEDDGKSYSLWKNEIGPTIAFHWNNKNKGFPYISLTTWDYLIERGEFKAAFPEFEVLIKFTNKNYNIVQFLDDFARYSISDIYQNKKKKVLVKIFKLIKDPETGETKREEI